MSSDVSSNKWPASGVRRCLRYCLNHFVRHTSWWRHQMETFSALLALCAGNSPVPVNSPHKGQWRGALMFSLICAWINDWVNNHEAEWRSGSVSALPCERPGFGPRTRPREIIPANNCTMQGQNKWGNWGSPGVMKLWVAWEVLRWLMKFRELCSGGFHPKLVTPPYHGFLNVNTPPNSQNSKRH